MQKISVEFVHSRQQKVKNFLSYKDDYGKYGWKWLLLFFIDTVATVYILTARKNDIKNSKTRRVHFVRLLNNC